MFYDKFTRMCEAEGVSPSRVLTALKISKGSLANWRNGIEPLNETKKKIADYFGITVQQLMQDETEKAPAPKSEDYNTAETLKFKKGNEDIDSTHHNPVHRIPILGRVAAGLPLYADEQILGYTYTERNGGAEYFGLLVSGDSMNATTIVDGSIIIVRKQEAIDNGQVAVVMVDGEDATVKRFYREKNTVTLMPQSNNSEHKPQMYDLRETDISIIGKVVEVKNDIE